MAKMAVSLGCASRFAVLKLEDDEEDKIETNKSKAKITKTNESQAAKKKQKKKKITDEKDTNDLKNLAFGLAKQKKKNGSSKSFPNSGQFATEEQWEEWKKKDREYVTDSYEQDLQQALLLSKMDFEERKQYVENMKGADEAMKKGTKKNTKKKEKQSSTLTLGQFNNLHSSQINAISKDGAGVVNEPHSSESKSSVNSVEDKLFFEKIAEDAEKIVTREQRYDALKKMNKKDENARALQFQDELEKKDKEIELLKEEVVTLKSDLTTVKTRNKKLCNILASGEMREKAEILIQVEQLTKVRDELTDQVSELHAALEQERSKVHALQMEMKKHPSGGRKESR